jgi:hypothetical protein
VNQGRSVRIVCIAGPIAALVTLGPLGASAQDTQAARDKATSLAKAGAVLLDEGKLDQALELFEKAYKLDPAPVLLGHMAKVHERKGEFAKARELYERFLAQETDPDRIAKGRARLAEVLDRIPGKLFVTVFPEDAKLTIDRNATRPGSAVDLKRGTHELEVNAKGYSPVRRTAEVLPGKETRLSVVLMPLPGRIEIRGGPRGARVTVDGADARTLPLDRPYVVPPGVHDVEVNARGYEKFTRKVDIVAESSTAIDVEMVVLPVATASRSSPVGAVVAAPGEEVSKNADLRSSPWPWICIGTGAAALGAGVVMTGLAYRERSLVNGAARVGDVVTDMTMIEAASHSDKARTFDTTSYVMYGVGGAAVLTGIILAVTLPKDAMEADSVRPALAASPVPGGMAVSAAWGF